MNIDNRIFIPIVMPFVMLAMVRALWFLAGAEWSNSQMAASSCLVVGVWLGGMITWVMFDHGCTIGFIKIGRVK